MTVPELLPCPFCGEAMELRGDYTHEAAWNYFEHANAIDSKCILKDHTINAPDFRTPDPAEAAEWNKRAALPLLGVQQTEALQAAIDRCQLFLDTFGDVGDCVTQADINDWNAALSAQSGSGVMRREDVARSGMTEDLLFAAHQALAYVARNVPQSEEAAAEQRARDFKKAADVVLAIPRHPVQAVEGWSEPLAALKAALEFYDGLPGPHLAGEAAILDRMQAALSASPTSVHPGQPVEGEKL